jgi:hypothetical protein
MDLIYKAFTIRNRKFPPREGIICKKFQISFDPEFGMSRHGIPCLGVITKDIEIIHYCKIFLTAHCPVIVPIEGQPDEYSGQLLLVQQFSGKRSGFWLNDSEEAIVRKISEARTAGGSGSEWWVLVTAPREFKLINED